MQAKMIVAWLEANFPFLKGELEVGENYVRFSVERGEDEIEADYAKLLALDTKLNWGADIQDDSEFFGAEIQAS
jgi:hypothetical protein